MEQNTTPETNKMSPSKEGGTGAFIGSLIIIIVIILGGVYVFNLIKDEVGIKQDTNTIQQDSNQETGTQLNTADDIKSIEADISGSDINNLDKELDAIDAEFENI
jgi:uncharacterized protein HemX